MTDRIERLSNEYRKWCDEHSRPGIAYFDIGDASELLAHLQLTREDLAADSEYLRIFIDRWERAEEQAKDDSALDAERFEAWRATRQWFHDLRDYVKGDEDLAVGPGYGYRPGWIALNTTGNQEIGRYMTCCPFDVWGNLEHCERALWEGHARAEWED